MQITITAFGLKQTSAVFAIFAGILYGGFWLLNAIFAKEPSFWNHNQRIDMVLIGFVSMVIGFWIASRIHPADTSLQAVTASAPAASAAQQEIKKGT